MEVKELMIGDIVMWHDSKHIIDGTDFTTWKSDGVYEKASMDFSPIPLTLKILEKNGFEEYRDGKYQLVRFRSITKTDTIIIEPMMIESRLGNNWFWLTNVSREMEVVKPRLVYPFVYVHQLQQALRLCGLNELADNFKI